MAVKLATCVAALRRRVVAAEWTARAGGLLGWTIAGCATAALLARGIGDWQRTESAWLFAPVVAAPIVAWVLARRSRPSAAAAAAWLDVHAGAAGYVVTENELGQSSWTPRTEEALTSALAALPRVDVVRAAKPVLAAAVFAAVALWIELPETVVGPPQAVSTAALERVEEQIETLEDALAVEPELAEELEERLEAAKADAEAGNPESTFEALDALEQRIEQAVEHAEQMAEQAARELNQAATDPNLAKAQDALKNALSKMDSAGLSKDLPKSVQEALPEGAQSLDGEQLSSAELAKLARELKGGLDARLAKLANGRLVDASKRSPGAHDGAEARVTPWAGPKFRAAAESRADARTRRSTSRARPRGAPINSSRRNCRRRRCSTLNRPRS
ncbi:MAG: hypothetical protein NTV21_08620 [Planctomycetota bacterium]|nr:hypothetical protein [Planctomycetota bacterium]